MNEPQKSHLLQDGLRFFKYVFTDLFNIHPDSQDANIIEDNVTSGSVFKGVNLWALICAILIASLGLNMNSTAVIIGAMLVSPLMGPIIAMGFSLATFNIGLLNQAWKNLLLFMGISLIISTLYFFVSPLREPTTELIARTYPTIFDVLIALFGGTAGMIGSGQKEKGNIIPGVAIATALMPPLCTAGYGIATLNLNFFFGAMYLFTINTVMIAFSAYIVSKLVFRIPVYQYTDKLRAKRVNRIILIVMLATILPSIYLAYTLVLSSAYNQRVDRFIKEELTSRDIFVLQKKVSYKERTVDLFLLTLPSKERQEMLQHNLKLYGMDRTTLIFKSAENMLKSQEQKMNSDLQQKNLAIAALEDSLEVYQKRLAEKKKQQVADKTTNERLLKQLHAIDQNVEGIGVSPLYTNTGSTDGSLVVMVKSSRRVSGSTKQQVERFLTVQYPNKKVSVVYQ